MIKLLDLAVKKKIEKHRERVLHYDSLLQKNQFVKPVPSSILKKCSKNRKTVSNVEVVNQDDNKVSMLYIKAERSSSSRSWLCQSV